jgi:alanyl-tRNA synthetase
MIGPFTIVSESSIGSGVRRIEAVTGTGALQRAAERAGLLTEAAALLRTEPEHVPEALERLLERQRATEKQLEQARSREILSEAASLAAEAVDGAVVARRDGLSADLLRALAQRVVESGRIRAAVLGGRTDGGRASLVVASADDDLDAGAVVKQLAPLLGGGGGGSAEVAVAGGKDPAGVDRALEEARRVVASG